MYSLSCFTSNLSCVQLSQDCFTGANKQGERTVHLKEIVLYGETDNDKLNSTTITWKSQVGVKDTDQATFNKLANGYVFPGDFNGDGYMDYIHYAQLNSKSIWRLYTYNPSNGKYEDSQKSGTHKSLNFAEDNCYFYKADIKGDGCDKLIIAEATELELRNFFFTILDLKGSSVTQIDTFSLYTYATSYIGVNIGLPQMINSNKVRLGDFTGDGTTNVELVFNPYHTIDGSVVKKYYYNGSKFAGYSTELNPKPTPNYLCDRYSGDFNGDGISTSQTQDSIAILDDWEECPRGLELKKQYHFNLTRRGFTGHEHYPDMKIINMNGRLYDPVIARFFSPDNYVQIPEFTQSFNRYSYCLNNPLSYTDPTGQMWNPIFDRNGFLKGCTSEGFVGEVLVYSGDEFVDWSKMCREGAKQYAKDKKNSLINIQEADLSAKALSKIYTRILLEGGFFTSKLMGKAVAVRNGEDMFNNPSGNDFASGSLGIPSKVSVNQRHRLAKELLTTVENIQNLLGVHELQGHGQNKFGTIFDTHHKAFELQLNHSTWDNTTSNYKAIILQGYLEKYSTEVPNSTSSSNYIKYHKLWEFYKKLGQ